MNSNIMDISEKQLEQILIKAGLRAEDAGKVVADFAKYETGDLKSISVLSSINWSAVEDFQAKLKDLRVKAEAMPDSIRHYLRYFKYKQEIINIYGESKDWNKVFSGAVYSDVDEAQEAFIDYVEDVYNLKVTDTKHLQELTGITHTDTWDSIQKKYITPKTEAEAKENALSELSETLFSSRYSKYIRALDRALQNGVRYNDLLLIKPEVYGLPETWENKRSYNQHTAIVATISDVFLLDEPGALMLLPDLRSIAKELEAPYSVVMDAHNMGRHLFDTDPRRVVSKMKELEGRLKQAVRKYIEQQPEDWKADRLMVINNDWSEDRVKYQKQQYVDFFITWFRIVLHSDIIPNKPLDKYEVAVIKEHKELITTVFGEYYNEAKDIYSLPA